MNLKTDWDYSKLAKSYLKRSDYSIDAINEVFTLIGDHRYLNICDVGAGTGNLTKLMAPMGHSIVAIEPNAQMRELGIEQTTKFKNVSWEEATGENTKQKDSFFDLVTFGSSFNVTDRVASLKEASRILKNNGWFLCMWNHRDLLDPLQLEIEKVIHTFVPTFSYGSRREDQSLLIESSKLFKNLTVIEKKITHKQSADDFIEAWRSHATLSRQSGDKFKDIISTISSLIENKGDDLIAIPFTTKAWMAQLK